MKELILTEKTYVEKLKTLIEVFIVPIRDANIITVADIQSQFLNIENIYGLHIQLYNDLTQEENLADLKIGSIFGLYAHFLKMYTQYLTNFEIAMTRRAELMTSNKSFSQLLDKSIVDPRCKGSGIESFLVEPVQRIPRYRMLMEQILKFTPEDHIDYEDLKASLAKVSEVAAHNNEAIRHREHKERIMSIMMTFEPRSRINLLDEPSRHLVKEGELLRQTRFNIALLYFCIL